MAKSYNDIREMLSAFMNSDAVTVVGTVTQIDRENRTCNVEVDGVEIYDALLQSVTGSDKGIVVYPKVGSYVMLLHRRENDSYMVMLSSDVEEIAIICDNITINGGNNGGIVNIEALKTALNNIVGDINTIAGLLAKPVVNGSPVGTFTPSTNPPGEDFEDTTIKH